MNRDSHSPPTGFSLVRGSRTAQSAVPQAARNGEILRDRGCAPETIRTSDTRFRRAVLYPLSYEGPLGVAEPAYSISPKDRGRSPLSSSPNAGASPVSS